MIDLFRVTMSPHAGPALTDLFTPDQHGRIYVGEGNRVRLFEQAFVSMTSLYAEPLSEAVYPERPGYGGVNSCSAALDLSLRMIGVGPGDEVVSSAITCVSYHTPVLLADGGTMAIGQIVDSQLSPMVQSYNTITGRFEPKQVTGWTKIKVEPERWRRLSHEGARPTNSVFGRRGVWITGDHRVWTQDGFVAVDDLHVDHRIATNELVPSAGQQELLDGILLGDASMRAGQPGKPRARARLSVMHSAAQREWVQLQERGLSGFATTVAERPSYGRSAAATGFAVATGHSWQTLYERWYPDGTKRVPKDLVLTPRLLAAWYLDDGSRQENRAVLCTEGFEADDVAFLAERLAQIGLHADIGRIRDGQYRLYIGNGIAGGEHNPKASLTQAQRDDIDARRALGESAKHIAETLGLTYNTVWRYASGRSWKAESLNKWHGSAQRLFRLIAKYVPESMRYKLPPDLDGLDAYDSQAWELDEPAQLYAEPSVVWLEPPEKEQPGYAYCLEVEDNHTFVAAGVVIANCSATNGSIVNLGAKIVWADVDPLTGNIDPVSVARMIGPKTKAVIAVDWGGRPCDYPALRVAASYKHDGIGWRLPIVQDAAHRLYVADPHGDYVCFPGSTSVETPTGPRRIASIRVGDKVIAGDGVARRVAVVHERSYDGDYARIKAGQARLVATANHPIRVHRDGQDQWLSAGEVVAGDAVYVVTKPCGRCPTLVPYYGTVCATCYQASANDYNGKRRAEAAEKHALSIKTARGLSTSRVAHHERDVVPVMERYEQDGYRVIPIVRVIPDFIAIKDGRVVAVEVESATSVAGLKQVKYDRLNGHGYDDVVWHTRPRTKDGARYKYEIVGDLARVPVSSVVVAPANYANQAHRRVYNLTIEGEPTYFARGFLVHNCWSYGPIKHLTGGGYGGGILVPPDQRTRARLLRWHGLDRLSGSDFRCAQDIEPGPNGEAGFRYHLTDDMATVMLCNLPLAVNAVTRARENAAWYCRALANIPGVHVLPYDPRCNYWIYTILVDDRASFSAFLGKRGIATSQVHARNDRHTVFKAATVRSDRLAGTDAFDAHQVSIPVGWWVGPQDRQAVVDAIWDWSVANGLGAWVPVETRTTT